jgi:hypothetical protein
MGDVFKFSKIAETATRVPRNTVTVQVVKLF